MSRVVAFLPYLTYLMLAKHVYYFIVCIQWIYCSGINCVSLICALNAINGIRGYIPAPKDNRVKVVPIGAFERFAITEEVNAMVDTIENEIEEIHNMLTCCDHSNMNEAEKLAVRIEAKARFLALTKIGEKLKQLSKLID